MYLFRRRAGSGFAAHQRTARTVSQQRGGVLRQLLRLLFARGLQLCFGHLHRQGSLCCRRLISCCRTRVLTFSSRRFGDFTDLACGVPSLRTPRRCRLLLLECQRCSGISSFNVRTGASTFPNWSVVYSYLTYWNVSLFYVTFLSARCVITIVEGGPNQRRHRSNATLGHPVLAGEERRHCRCLGTFMLGPALTGEFPLRGRFRLPTGHTIDVVVLYSGRSAEIVRVGFRLALFSTYTGVWCVPLL